VVGLVGVEMVVLAIGSKMKGGDIIVVVVGSMDGEVSFIWLNIALCSSKDVLVVVLCLDRIQGRLIV
jgi:hypothetical protein